MIKLAATALRHTKHTNRSRQAPTATGVQLDKKLMCSGVRTRSGLFMQPSWRQLHLRSMVGYSLPQDFILSLLGSPHHSAGVTILWHSVPKHQQ